MAEGSFDKISLYQVELVVLFIGAVASLWMMISVSMKFRRPGRNQVSRDIDIILILIAVSDFICCTIKVLYRYAVISNPSGNWSTHASPSYPIANCAMMASFSWQICLTALIYDFIKHQGKRTVKLWVLHLLVSVIALLRGVQGYLTAHSVFNNYRLAIYFVYFMITVLLLVLIQRQLKQKSSSSTAALFSRIRLLPAVYLICIAPRLLATIITRGKSDQYPVIHYSTRILFYSFSLLHCLVYGASRSCVSLRSTVKTNDETLDVTIDPSQVVFSETSAIGTGGTGMVFKGKYRGSTVAIKKIHIGVLSAPRQHRIMFRQEALMLSRLVHPNIVYFMGAFLKGVNGYIVVEYCNQGSLRSILDHLHETRVTNACVDWNWRCKIALGTARGLLYLHQTAQPTIIHRDLKSPNVLVSDSYTAKVADFGTARLLSINTFSTPVVDASELRKMNQQQPMTTQLGTPRWTAPEIILGFMDGQACYTEAVDIYSFGMILWELTTFQFPFEGLNFVSEIYDAISAGNRPSIPPACHHRPMGWDELMTSCWAQSPCDRPTAASVVSQLEAIVARLTLKWRNSYTDDTSYRLITNRI